MNLVKIKLEVRLMLIQESIIKHDDDQIKDINKYRNEKDRLDKVTRKEILYYQNQIKNINMELSTCKIEEDSQIYIFEELNERMEKLVENKTSLELNLIFLRKEVNHINLQNNLDKINKIDIFSSKQTSNKIKIIEEEVNKIKLKINTVQSNIEKLKVYISRNVTNL